MDPKRSRQKPQLPELLAPAGTMEKLAMAIHYGADAVYLGGEHYSLRARAGNFDAQALPRAVAYAHARSTRVYVTVNIFAHNKDLPGLPAYLDQLARADVDGLIIADPGVLRIAQQTVPHLALHLSTQANVTNLASARFWADQGISRVNLARELSLEEITAIRQGTALELEVFVHGALCISYSGRCLLSTYLTGRDANRGDCAHPCRYAYRLVEEKRPGQYFPVEEDPRGTYIFNSRDLCLLQRLPELISTGVDAIKIEGRMKSVGYVGATVRLYRAALDWLQTTCLRSGDQDFLELPPDFQEEMHKIGTRGQTENFFSAAPTAADMAYRQPRTTPSYVPVGIIRNCAPLEIEARNVLQVGDIIEHLGQTIRPRQAQVTGLLLADGRTIERANPGNRVLLQTTPPLTDIRQLDLLRKQQGPSR